MFIITFVIQEKPDYDPTIYVEKDIRKLKEPYELIYEDIVELKEEVAIEYDVFAHDIKLVNVLELDE